MQNLSNEITAMSYLHKNNKDAKGEYGISHTITILNTNSYTPWDLMGWVEIEREKVRREAEIVDKPPVDFFKRNMTTHFLVTKNIVFYQMMLLRDKFSLV